MTSNTILQFIVDYRSVILGILLFFFVIYSIYLNVLRKEDQDQIQALKQKFSDKRIQQFERMLELFKHFVSESQGSKEHTISTELDVWLREHLVDSALLNAEKNLSLLVQWKKLLNNPDPVETKQVYKLFVTSIKNMRNELGLKSRGIKATDFIKLLHAPVEDAPDMKVSKISPME